MASITESAFSRPPNYGENIANNVQGGIKTGLEYAQTARRVEVQEQELQLRRKQLQAEQNALKVGQAEKGWQILDQAMMTPNPKYKPILAKRYAEYMRMIGKPVDESALKAVISDTTTQGKWAKIKQDLVSTDVRVQTAAKLELAELMSNDPLKIGVAMDQFSSQLSEYNKFKQEEAGKTQRAYIAGAIREQDLSAKRAFEQQELDYKKQRDQENFRLREKDIDNRYKAAMKRVGAAQKDALAKEYKDITDAQTDALKRLDTQQKTIQEANKIMAIVNDPGSQKNPYSAQAATTLFARALDPRTGVREQEYNRIASAIRMPLDVVRQAFGRYAKGEELTPKQWRLIGDAATVLANESETQIRLDRQSMSPFLNKRFQGSGFNTDDVYRVFPKFDKNAGRVKKTTPQNVPQGAKTTGTGVVLNDTAKDAARNAISKGKMEAVKALFKRQYGRDFSAEEINEMVK